MNNYELKIIEIIELKNIIIKEKQYKNLSGSTEYDNR